MKPTLSYTVCLIERDGNILEVQNRASLKSAMSCKAIMIAKKERPSYRVEVTEYSTTSRTI